MYAACPQMQLAVPASGSSDWLELVSMNADSIPSRGPWGFLLRRWRRQVPLATLFWRDMIVIASIVNVAAGATALILLGLKAGAAASMIVFLAPLPYNAFLLAAVWRATDLADALRANAYRLGASLWFVAAAII